MKRLTLLAFLVGCDRTPDLHVTLTEPAGTNLFSNVKQLELTVTRDDAVLAVRTSTHPSGGVSLSGLDYGADTVLTLVGQDSSGDPIARGATCGTDFQHHGGTVPMYFAPLRYFGATASAPSVERSSPSAAQLDDGTVLVAGGADTSKNPLASVDVFTPGTTGFSVGPSLSEARAQAVGVLIPSVAFVAIGGVGASGSTLPSAEIYSESQATFAEITGLVPRVDHQVIVWNGAAYVVGGRSSATDPSTALATVQELFVASGGTYTLNAGPSLLTARYAHAIALADDSLYVFGGYDASGTALASIEYLDLNTTAFVAAGSLTKARAGATASLLAAGPILVAGGKDVNGAALATAELYNRDGRTAQTFTMATARYGHTATVLPDGETVLIAGGFDDSGNALSSVELFTYDSSEETGFFAATTTELTTARADHVAVTNCDGTVLFVGGGAGAELYTPSD